MSTEPATSSSPVGSFCPSLLHLRSGTGLPDTTLHSNLAADPAVTIRTSSGIVAMTGLTEETMIYNAAFVVLPTSDSDCVGQLGRSIGRHLAGIHLKQSY